MIADGHAQSSVRICDVETGCFRIIACRSPCECDRINRCTQPIITALFIDESVQLRVPSYCSGSAEIPGLKEADTTHDCRAIVAASGCVHVGVKLEHDGRQRVSAECVLDRVELEIHIVPARGRSHPVGERESPVRNRMVGESEGSKVLRNDVWPGIAWKSIQAHIHYQLIANISDLLALTVCADR